MHADTILSMNNDDDIPNHRIHTAFHQTRCINVVNTLRLRSPFEPIPSREQFNTSNKPPPCPPHTDFPDSVPSVHPVHLSPVREHRQVANGTHVCVERECRYSRFNGASRHKSIPYPLRPYYGRSHVSDNERP